ncbi:hypothetical protein GCM10011390_10200 [Aureimonas endophytica]|uniref:Uncharacterized protein n=1 Tax=Aureimonas endophytica TaxID=2027858 RepID=A0A917E297_9HYPH|nr:hypothetical protein [Aureimonas endophytica]GGD93384.1 hypothetical protein GCM10011390_10200 [Aureimonas endophytica]
MPLRLADLSPMQIRTLAHLDDGHPHADSVGLQLGQEDGAWLEAADSLQTLGLAELSFGWQGVFWLRLTPAGRSMLMGRSA